MLIIIVSYTMVAVLNKKDNVLGCWLIYISDWLIYIADWLICVKATSQNVILYVTKCDNPAEYNTNEA